MISGLAKMRYNDYIYRCRVTSRIGVKTNFYQL